MLIINLINNDISIEEGELLDRNIKNWFSMNEKFIEKLIKSYIRDYGWAFGGASEMHLDIKQFYREYPYNFGEKYGEELSPSISLPMVA